MRPFFRLPHAWLPIFLLPALLLALSAHAGNISFNLAINGDRLTLSNQGDSPAFNPSVLRLLDNGHWEVLPPAPGSPAPVEFKPQAKFELVWSARPAPPGPLSLETLRPVMVRFSDQAGAGFGQISFFNQPQPAGKELLLEAGYVDGRLRIAAPKNAAIKATWVVWPQEEGIAALAAPVTAAQPQPEAGRIQWGAGSEVKSLDLGKGMPIAFLLHETPQGLRSQVVPSGRIPGRQQRAGWLDLGAQLRNTAMLALLAGLVLLAGHLAVPRQKSSINP